MVRLSSRLCWITTRAAPIARSQQRNQHKTPHLLEGSHPNNNFCWLSSAKPSWKLLQNKPLATILSEDEHHLYHQCERDFEDGHKIFRLETNKPTRRNKVYTLSRFITQAVPVTRYASIKPIINGKVTLHSTAIPLALPMPTANFWDTLDSFPNQSLWNYLQCNGNGFWITRDLMGGLLAMTHDGSHMVDVDSTLCSAAYIIRYTVMDNEAIRSIEEKIEDADNYRAKILGGMILQSVLRAASQKGTFLLKQLTSTVIIRALLDMGILPRTSCQRIRNKRTYYTMSKTVH